MKIRLRKSGFAYEITFDDEGALDTVKREHDGKLLSTKDAVCKSVLVHADAIRSGQIPKGFAKV